MNKIPVYKNEIEAGLQDKIVASSCKIQANCMVALDQKVDTNQVLANIPDLHGIKQEDLAIITSILVSTGKNLNDDIFIPEEVFAAKDTPINKPININHDNSQIIGHIVASRMLDKSGSELNVTSDNLPDNFDIEVVGVLYKTLGECGDFVNKVISDNGDQFAVSMEALFSDFAYGIQETEDGPITVIERNDDTSFLTSSLSIYGGSGKWEAKGKTYSVGRVLMNIIFSGKGIVLHPANPESIIKTVVAKKFTREEGNSLYWLCAKKIVKTNLDGEYIKSDSLEGSDSPVSHSEEKVRKMDKDNDKLVAEIEALKIDAEKNKSDQDALVAEKAELVAEKEALVAEKETLVEDNKTLSTEKDELTAQNTETQSKFDEVAEKLQAIETEKLIDSRYAEISKVTEIKADDVDATKQELGEMSEAEFTRMIKYVKAAAPAGSEFGPDGDSARQKKAQLAKDFNDTKASEASEEVLENVEVDVEPDLVVVAADEEVLEDSAKDLAVALLNHNKE